MQQGIFRRLLTIVRNFTIQERWDLTVAMVQAEESGVDKDDVHQEIAEIGVDIQEALAGYEKGYDQFWMTPDKDIGICVYKDGKWAEIILDVPDKKKLPKTKEEFEEFIHLIKKEIAFTGINNMSADRFLYDYED